jgi:hypothetical protein
MAWPSRPEPLNSHLLPVLEYSHRYSYPLTAREVWFWQIYSHYSYPWVCRLLSQFPHNQTYYYLPGQQNILQKRLHRFRYSQTKWQISRRISRKLQIFPTIAAVFVTGALAMNNSPVDDDIDILFITLPHTLWITRFFVNFYLKVTGIRRDPHLPEHSSLRVKNKICDNLWLDSDHLSIFTHDLYRAHEILQAKCLFDRGGLHYKFLKLNAWVGDYLPVAFGESVKKLKKPPVVKNWLFVLWPINLFFFLLQYLYMLPHKHGEKIGLGFAFFHPQPALSNVLLSNSWPARKKL